ncbi:protein of unknown function [Chryseobacterium sp. JV274]|nr:protein of unknown function [Chryseobacterium sp. JV274]
MGNIMKKKSKHLKFRCLKNKICNIQNKLQTHIINIKHISKIKNYEN